MVKQRKTIARNQTPPPSLLFVWHTTPCIYIYIYLPSYSEQIEPKGGQGLRMCLPLVWNLPKGGQHLLSPHCLESPEGRPETSDASPVWNLSPEGKPGTSVVSSLSGISGLSLDSTFLSALLFFLVLLLLLLFLLLAHSSPAYCPEKTGKCPL